MSPHPLIETKNLSKKFPISRDYLFAVRDISLKIYKGETLGLVGESGCGKSTFGRLLLRLHEATSGEIYFNGENLNQCSRSRLKHLRQKMQMVFQNPFGSLNPRFTVEDILAEPLDIHRLVKSAQRTDRVVELLRLVGLDASYLYRFPHELSGGQRQRICIARALASHPEFIVCDESLSALDVSIQAQIINLLRDLQRTMNLTLLFIAHDLSVIKYLCDRVAVMYLGQLVELAPNELLYQTPRHPYTQALLSCIPIPDPIKAKQQTHLPLLSTEISSSKTSSQGCPFASRCPHVTQRCKEVKPSLKEISAHHYVACHLFENF
ncbi:MAG: ABC transporter ATP-binding protein [Verrucomicrobia bacterium]|nr:ABC transporter ATP-binding protein [Verrucomicrobiota bacterium]MBS0645151.1 ABC transporter ATP-binding protein [Verrucomicrobiota bacterium]